MPDDRDSVRSTSRTEALSICSFLKLVSDTLASKRAVMIESGERAVRISSEDIDCREGILPSVVQFQTPLGFLIKSICGDLSVIESMAIWRVCKYRMMSKWARTSFALINAPSPNCGSSAAVIPEI